MEVVELIKVSKALAITRQAVGHGNRSTLYEWMTLLKIKPDNGVITRRELARLCVFGKAVSAIGSKQAAVKTTLDYMERVEDQEFYEFAFNPSSAFTQVQTA